MRILEINLKKSFVKLIPEVIDDFWHLYNIIYKNDKVYANTTRELRPDDKYARPKKRGAHPSLLGSQS